MTRGTCDDVREPLLGERAALTGGSADVYDENGVDRSMIRSALHRTPTECLDLLEDLLELAEGARRVSEPLR